MSIANESLSVMKNVLPQMEAWWPIIQKTGYLIGFFFIIGGISSLASNGRNGGSDGKKKGFTSFFSGILLVNLMAFLNIMAVSIINEETKTQLSYQGSDLSDPSSVFITFAVYTVMMLSLGGFVYSFILFKRSAEDGRLLTSAFTHLIGGTLGVNIVSVVGIFSASLGSGISDIMNAILGASSV